jgi:hypothetical protein
VKGCSNAGALLVIASCTLSGCGGITGNAGEDGEVLIRAEDVDGTEPPRTAEEPTADANDLIAGGPASGEGGAANLLPGDGQGHDLVALGTLHQVLLGAAPECSDRHDCGTGDFSGTMVSGSLALDDRPVAEAELRVELRDRWTGVDSDLTIEVHACLGETPE